MLSFRKMVTAGLFAVSVFPLSAQEVQFPAASPSQTINQRVGLTDIEIEYSRPGVKDREIFGGLIKYGEVWRTGANAATKITFSTPVTFGGEKVQAGTYSLFTIPGKTEWTVILNENPEQWGSYQYDESKDVVRVSAEVYNMDFSVETFLIDIGHIRDESAFLTFVWDTVAVSVPIEVDVKSVLVPQIEEVMSSDSEKKPFFQAALFYHDHDLDLDKAQMWAEQMVAQRDAFWSRHLLAKVLAKQGEKDAALAQAEKSRAMAIEAGDSSYVKSNDDLIASLVSNP